MASHQPTHIRFFLTEHTLRYLVVTQSDTLFTVSAYGTHTLPQGMIAKGEIIQSQAFADLLKEIKTTLTPLINQKTTTTVLLQSSYFEHVTFPLVKYNPKKDIQKQIEAHLKTHTSSFAWMSTHHYEYLNNQEDMVTLEILHNDIDQSIRHAFTQAGYMEIKIVSDTSSLYTHIKEPDATILIFTPQATRVVEYKNHMIFSEQRFGFSYHSATHDIKKILGCTEAQAQNIFKEYGVSQAHKDVQVYNKLTRSLTPLIDFLRKKKVEHRVPVYLWYYHTPIVGMDDVLHKKVNVHVEGYDYLKNFEDILILHKQESYQYSPLLAYTEKG